MKYFQSILILPVLFLSSELYAQDNDTIMKKIREEYSYERILKNNINTNPANMLGSRKYQLTVFNIFTQNNDTPNEIKQKGNGKNLLGTQTNTHQILDPKTVVWGNASYSQGKNKQVVWNENTDYDIIYPYVAADSVGGDMKFENYSFSGGYSKQINSYTLGITGSYRASLSYRDIDPRPKNTSANFSLTLGVNKMMFGKFKIGAYAEAEKYTQKHYLSFVSSQGFPMIYNMNGLGNYNELLSGKFRQAYYEGWTYGGGLQIFEAENRSWYLTAGIKQFNLDKLLTEYSDLNASKIDEQQFNFSMGKFFETGRLSWGISAIGNHTNRKGTENLFLNDNSRNYIQIGTAEKYNHKVTHLILKGLLATEHQTAKSSLMPFLGMSKEKETYNSPISIIDLNKIVYGADYQWLNTFTDKLAISVSMGISVTDVYKKEATFNSSDKPAIQKMLQDNYSIQSSGFWQAKLDLNFHFKVPVIKNAYVGGKMIYSHFKNDNNILFTATVGGIF